TGARSGQGGSSQSGTGDGDGQPRTGRDLDLSTVFDPPTGAASGDDWMLRGQPSGQGPERTRGRQQGKGLRNTSIVPYRDVIAEYRRTAARAVEREGYPLRLRTTVRDYFDRLGGWE
ncbi:MAG TPA: hypothetical protein VM307_13735, partial [Egibacteraceae bacterium]|nr:hypothetical protein [Egibacteraceae bacterium]